MSEDLKKGISMILALRGAAQGPGFSSVNQLILGMCASCEPGISSCEILKILPVSPRCLYSIGNNMCARGVVRWEQGAHPTKKGALVRRYYLTEEGERRIKGVMGMIG